MRKAPIQYVIVGLLLGILLTAFLASYAVNNNQPGIMNMMGMNRRRVMSGDMDKNFIEQMIPHHESAIAMARLAKEKSKRSEIKTLADDILAGQTAEINNMKEWYKNWFKADVPTVTADNMWGGHTMNSQSSIASLSAAADFDKAFLEEMIPHHQMAVMMGNMLKISSNRPEMQKLANDIIAAQTKEINDMKSWQQHWGYETNNNDSSDMMNIMGH